MKRNKTDSEVCTENKNIKLKKRKKQRKTIKHIKQKKILASE